MNIKSILLLLSIIQSLDSNYQIIESEYINQNQFLINDNIYEYNLSKEESENINLNEEYLLIIDNKNDEDIYNDEIIDIIYDSDIIYFYHSDIKKDYIEEF